MVEDVEEAIEGSSSGDHRQPSQTSSRASDVDTTAWEAGAVPERVGRYVVEGELARGGMGIVYAARDERLDRRVALKALPESLARDPVRRARLEREAKLLALVHDPGVATIFDLVDEGARTFLALEFVEGETLQERLLRGPLDLRAALSTCASIAKAVAAAHERGVVHRDLKPANVKITPDGVVKVLDFGLAKGQGDADEVSAEIHELDDATAADITRAGAVMGTLAYMAPEQLRGGAVDRRADAWALGCVLYECLSGLRTWGGARNTERARAIRLEDPDWTQLPAATPDAVRRVLASCLEKDLPRRLSRVGDLREVLQEELDRLDGRVVVKRAGAGARVGNLPRQLTSFLGRESARDDVARRVRAGGLVTLLGAGGTGKTRLALEVAREVGAELEGGAWFVDLVPVNATGEGSVLAAVASALGVVEGGGRGLREQVEAHLTARETLVVLDNCEHVVAEAAAVAAGLLEACPELRVVATSREALQVEGEQVVPVEPLGVPQAGAVASVEQALQHDAVRLYVERARAAEQRFELTASNVELVSEACRLLDGLPLAIELAAARARSQPLERLVRRLREGEDVGTGRERRGPDRHRTLRQLIDWSHGLLEEAEKAAYRRLSVFAGSFPLEAAEAVVAGTTIAEEDVIELLGRLVERSLVAVESRAGEARYRLLETVKAHGRKRLDESGEEPEARRRHLEWYRREGQRVVKHLAGADAKRWLERAEELREDAKAAAAWAQTSGETEAALEVAAAYGEAWHKAGHLEEARALLSAVLAGEGAVTLGRAAAVIELGEVAHDLGLAEEMRDRAEEGLGLARELGDRSKEAAAADLLVRVVLRMDGPRNARALVADFGVNRRDPVGVSQVTAHTQVRVALAEGAMSEAIRLGREWLAHARHLAVAWDTASAMTTLGVTLMRTGPDAHGEARQLLEAALLLRKRVGDDSGAAACLLNLSNIEFAAGRHQAARERLAEMIPVASRCGHAVLLQKAINNVAWLDHHDGQHTAARRGYAEALRLTARLGDFGFGLDVIENVALLDAQCGALKRAATLLGATLALREAFGTPAPVGDVTRSDAEAILLGGAGRADLDIWLSEGRSLNFAEASRLALESPPTENSSAD